MVGVDTVEFLDHPDGMVEYGLPLRRDIARAIRVHRPEVVITLNFEVRFAGGMTNQADHRAVGLAALDASKDAGQPLDLPGVAGGGARAVGRREDGARGRLSGGDARGRRRRARLQGVESLKRHEAYIAGLGTDMDPEMFLTMIANATGAQFDATMRSASRCSMSEGADGRGSGG